MEKLVEKGLVRSIGLSNFNSCQINDILSVASIKPTVLQVMIVLHRLICTVFITLATGIGRQCGYLCYKVARPTDTDALPSTCSA